MRTKRPGSAILAEVAIGAALVASCTSGGTGPARVTTSAAAPTSTAVIRPRPSASPNAARSELSCGNYVDAHASTAPLKVVLGVVALPVSPVYSALSTSTSATAGAKRLFAKTGLLVKPGATFELVVPPAFSHRGEIGWGGEPSIPSDRVIVTNCADPGGSGWLAYPGGYWVDHPVCLPLIVKAGGRQQEVHIGVGAACPGQRPPQAPSQR